MSIDQFIEKLKATPRNWRFDSRGRIRFEACCPVTVFEKRADLYVRGCANRLGLTDDDWQTIARAADNDMQKDADYPMRERLIDVCGLRQVVVCP